MRQALEACHKGWGVSTIMYVGVSYPTPRCRAFADLGSRFPAESLLPARRSPPVRSSSSRAASGREVLSEESRAEQSELFSSSSSSAPPPPPPPLTLTLTFRNRLPGLVEDYLAGKLTVDDYITHSVGSPFTSLACSRALTFRASQSTLTDINKGFDFMKEGTCIRCVVDMQK